MNQAVDLAPSEEVAFLPNPYIPMLSIGELYAGIILGKNGDADHHLILLPAKFDGRLDHKKATEWAAENGGELPNRREQSLLYANLKEEFEEAGYWSGETHAAYADYAWYQFFDNGSQHNILKLYTMRVRAVRRIAI